jgi:hypothetical protein
MSHLPPQVPIPVMPVTFVTPSAYQRRPGIVTGLGVASIVVAVLTAIACFVVMIWCFIMLANAASAPRTARMRPPVVMQNTGKGAIAQAVEEDPINGLSKAKRNMAMAGLTRARALTPPRVKQMNALLARAGRLMFPITVQGSSAKLVQSNVSESGILPGARGGDGPNFYIIGAGRIEVYDDHAVFRPTGSADVVSVNADEAKQEDDAVAMQMYTPTPATVVTVNEEKPFAIVLLIEALASGALAIYLFVAGILVLRNVLSGRKLHWIYIWIKLPLALVAVAMTAWLWWQYGEAARLNPGSTFTGEEGMAMGVMIAAIFGLVYPLALMMTLKSRGMKDYYVQAKEDALARGV